MIKLRQKYDKAVGAQLQRIKQGLERDSHYMEAYCIKDNRADRQSKSLSSQRDNMGSTFDK